MKKHERVQKTDDYPLNSDWQDDVTIDKKHKEHRPEFLKLMEVLANIWYNYLENITIAEHLIEISN